MKCKLNAKPLSMILAISLGIIAEDSIAHGTTTDPISRAYYCRYQDSPENPQTEACKAAKEASGTTQLFYDWMGVLQSNANGNHQAVVPNGMLCSGGDNATMRGYNEQSADWQWPATPLTAGSTYTFKFEEQAPHQTEYFKFYITKDSYDHSQPLTWADLEAEPFCEIGPGPSEPLVTKECILPANKSGRHIIYTIWQRRLDYSPEAFYACSDVDFGGVTPTPTPVPTPTPEPSPSPSPSPAPVPTPVPTPIPTPVPTPVPTPTPVVEPSEYKLGGVWFWDFTQDSVYEPELSLSQAAAEHMGQKPNPDGTIPVVEVQAITWNSGDIYVENDVVTHNGTTYRAKWWTQGDEPGTTGQWGVWETIN